MIRAAVVSLLALLLPAAAAAQTPARDPIVATIAAHGFDGMIAVASADRMIWAPPPAACVPPPGQACMTAQPDRRRWPWASVSKQMLAILTLQQVDKGKLALDARADRYLPALKGKLRAPTIRELLQHRAGLRNTDDSGPGTDGFPAFFTDGRDGFAWCIDQRVAPGGDWRYNNCDSIVLGAVLARVTNRSVRQLFADGIATPLGLDMAGYVDGGGDDQHRPAILTAWGPVPSLSPFERDVLIRFGAAGGLSGSARDLIAIDRALLAGRLLSPGSRDLLWQGDPKLGYMALGQWVFSAPLKGCTAPVRIVERRGAIGRFQVRNLILPDRDRIVVAFTAVEEGKFDFGEIWQGKGFAYDLLSAAAC